MSTSQAAGGPRGCSQSAIDSGQVVVLCCLIAAAAIKVADEYEMGEESIGLTPFQSSSVVLLFTFGILALVLAVQPRLLTLVTPSEIAEMFVR